MEFIGKPFYFLCKISVVGSPLKSVAHGNKNLVVKIGHFNWIYGLALQAERKVWFFNSFNVGVEWVCDYSLKRSLQISGIPVRDHNRVGFLAGHAFLFDKFNFSQQIGFFAYNPVPGMFSIYHRWGLYYRLGKNCMAGFNLLAHKQIADFLDVRFIYTFRKLGTQ